MLAELAERPLDHVALLIGGVEGGRPPRLPRHSRLRAWSASSEMVALTRWRRRSTRIAALEYALSPSTRPGWAAAARGASGRHPESASRWILLVSPSGTDPAPPVLVNPPQPLWRTGGSAQPEPAMPGPHRPTARTGPRPHADAPSSGPGVPGHGGCSVITPLGRSCHYSLSYCELVLK